jgi:hypothetical protein
MEERDDEMNPRRIDAERPENREGSYRERNNLSKTSWRGLVNRKE